MVFIGVSTMKSFLMQTLCFVIWCFVLVIVSMAPIFLDKVEAIAAILCATFAGVAIITIVFWEG
jgi:hypothetical protein